MHIRNFRVDTGIRKSAILCDALALKAKWTEVRKGIAAGVVVICIAANKGTKCEDSIGVEEVCPARGDVECADLGALVLRTDELATQSECAARADGRSEASIVNNDAKPRRGVLCVERVRSLKPGTGVQGIEVDRVRGRDLIIHTIEYVFLVAFVVHHAEFRRIQESAAVQTVCGYEIAPFLGAIGEVEARIGGAERAVGGGDAAMRRGDAQP